ncbi:MAG: hypothetical protein JEY71_10450 [Sphaerochaeta sp.]|nr:hypothetical protein [Sphaerochaeta sp.]
MMPLWGYPAAALSARLACSLPACQRKGPLDRFRSREMGGNRKSRVREAGASFVGGTDLPVAGSGGSLEQKAEKQGA